MQLLIIIVIEGSKTLFDPSEFPSTHHIISSKIWDSQFLAHALKKGSPVLVQDKGGCGRTVTAEFCWQQIL